MRKYMITLFATSLVFNAATAATEGENQANSFANIYASLCLRHLNNLEELREKLKPMPKFPPEQAALFLSGNAGDAWPVPDEHGTFVLALPAGKNICVLHVRRADTESARKQFEGLVATAPSPLVARQVTDEQGQTQANGQTHTVAYEWSVPGASRKLLFMLTTAPSETAQLQVLGSASITGE